MNLYHLRYFSTLAHIEHYTKAADILAITQPSLSYAISTLEEELGVKLFEKNGRNVPLPKYGKVFLKDVEEVLNRLDSSVNSLKLAGKGEGCIDVAFLRTLGIDFLPKIMRGFLAENPAKKIDFNLYCDKVLTSDILNGLKEKKYDLGFCSKLDNEPLIENNKTVPFIADLMEKRRAKYEAAADIIIETDGKNELEICEELVHRLRTMDEEK